MLATARCRKYGQCTELISQSSYAETNRDAGPAWQFRAKHEHVACNTLAIIKYALPNVLMLTAAGKRVTASRKQIGGRRAPAALIALIHRNSIDPVQIYIQEALRRPSAFV